MYNPQRCWGSRRGIVNPNKRFRCHGPGQTGLGLCHECHAEIVGTRELTSGGVDV